MSALEIRLLEFVSNAVSYLIAAPVPEKFAIMGGIFMAAALFWNAAQIIRKKVRPAPASWAVWASLDIILASSMYLKNTLNPQMAVAATGAGIIFLLTLPYGKPGWNPIDKYCLAGGAAAVVLWLFTGNPTVATTLTLIAIAAGCWPTYDSIRENRAREDSMFWSVAFASSACALIGTTEMSYDALAQPVVFVIAQAYALWLLFRPQREEKA